MYGESQISCRCVYFANLIWTSSISLILYQTLFNLRLPADPLISKGIYFCARILLSPVSKSPPLGVGACPVSGHPNSTLPRTLRVVPRPVIRRYPNIVLKLMSKKTTGHYSTHVSSPFMEYKIPCV